MVVFDMPLEQFLLLWTLLSSFILLLWSIMVGDPGSSNLSNTIISIICAILALPVTILILFIGLCFYITCKYYTEE